MRELKTRWRREAIRLVVLGVLVVVVSKIAVGLPAIDAANEGMLITSTFGPNQPLPPKSRIELHTSRPLSETEGRLAIVIGDMDVTSLCAASGTDISYSPRPFPLPVGETSVIVYLVSADNEWTEVARLPLLVEEPKQSALAVGQNGKPTPPPGIAAASAVAPVAPPAQKAAANPFQFIPSVSVNVKSQSTALFFPDSSRPDRLNFTDIAVQMSLQGNYQSQVVSIQNQFELAGTSVQNETLRFGQMGNDAPQFDLSAYTMQYQVYKAKLSLGNVSFGSNRELINSFTSRGLSLTIPITKRFDISGAIMNGTSIVGYANFFGLNRSQHQIRSATLGIELLEKRPGGFRIELTGLNGSLLPLSSFNQGLVSDAEKSKGGSVRVVGSDKSQRFRFDGGFARSRFTNPADPLLYQGRKPAHHARTNHGFSPDSSGASSAAPLELSRLDIAVIVVVVAVVVYPPLGLVLVNLAGPATVVATIVSVEYAATILLGNLIANAGTDEGRNEVDECCDRADRRYRRCKDAANDMGIFAPAARAACYGDWLVAVAECWVS